MFTDAQCLRWYWLTFDLISFTFMAEMHGCYFHFLFWAGYFSFLALAKFCVLILIGIQRKFNDSVISKFSTMMNCMNCGLTCTSWWLIKVNCSGCFTDVDHFHKYSWVPAIEITYSHHGFCIVPTTRVFAERLDSNLFVWFGCVWKAQNNESYANLLLFTIPFFSETNNNTQTWTLNTSSDSGKGEQRFLISKPTTAPLNTFQVFHEKSN